MKWAALLLLAGCASAPPALRTPQGQAMSLPGLQGKVVLLDFWATWCEPCKATLPATQRLAERLAPQGLSVYAVNVEAKPDEAAPFLRKLGVTLPLLFDQDGALAEQLGGRNLPFAVLLDARREVRFRMEGAPDDAEKRIAQAAEALLAGGAP
jgi:thiol-disulfide isomerase/thioredoxin